LRIHGFVLYRGHKSWLQKDSFRFVIDESDFIDSRVQSLKIRFVDSICRPVFKRFFLWIRFVRSKIPNYSIRFVSEGFLYDSRILTIFECTCWWFDSTFFINLDLDDYSEQILIEKLIRNSSAIHSHKNVTTWIWWRFLLYSGCRCSRKAGRTWLGTERRLGTFRADPDGKETDPWRGITNLEKKNLTFNASSTKFKQKLE
jgi:hypothetical protein